MNTCFTRQPISTARLREERGASIGHVRWIGRFVGDSAFVGFGRYDAVPMAIRLKEGET